MSMDDIDDALARDPALTTRACVRASASVDRFALNDVPERILMTIANSGVADSRGFLQRVAARLKQEVVQQQSARRDATRFIISSCIGAPLLVGLTLLACKTLFRGGSGNSGKLVALFLITTGAALVSGVGAFSKAQRAEKEARERLSRLAAVTGDESSADSAGIR